MTERDPRGKSSFARRFEKEFVSLRKREQSDLMVGEGVSTYGQQMQKWEKQRVNRYVPLAEKRKVALQTEDPPRDREDVVTRVNA
ncbi:hypothetical protein TGFOU_313277 [Toxoplasma gondii FOU]|uniref:Uncharacterized protein n=1 Tax=Toxoplasma gondii FOU TaxID=943167 RepID=A0A086LHI9_TOXGO|nr:hypothetical protein TGFOU_313277 [Toxoplasma gondii FOU]